MTSQKTTYQISFHQATIKFVIILRKGAVRGYLLVQSFDKASVRDHDDLRKESVCFVSVTVESNGIVMYSLT